jgi:hypothetical protein
MGVHVDTARQHQQSGGVDLFARRSSLTQLDDSPVLNANVGGGRLDCRDHRAVPNCEVEHRF